MISEFYKITKKAINFVFIIAVPLMAYFILFAKEGIFLLSGSAYIGAVKPMQIIMPTLVFIGLTNIMGIQMLVPMGKEKIVLYSEIAGALIDLVINIVLIPRWASAGAAIGTLVAEIIVWIVQYCALRKDVKSAYLTIDYKTILWAILMAVVGVVWVKTLSINVFFKLIISAVMFFGIYFGVLMIRKDELTIEMKNQLVLLIGKKLNKH